MGGARLFAGTIFKNIMQLLVATVSSLTLFPSPLLMVNVNVWGPSGIRQSTDPDGKDQLFWNAAKIAEGVVLPLVFVAETVCAQLHVR
jgi:hypothetical protein